jgi:hypothetical protein
MQQKGMFLVGRVAGLTRGQQPTQGGDFTLEFGDLVIETAGHSIELTPHRRSGAAVCEHNEEARDHGTPGYAKEA